MYKPKQVGILLVGSALPKKCRASLPLPRGSFFKRENNNNVVIISTYIALYIFKALCKHQLMGHSRISSVSNEFMYCIIFFYKVAGAGFKIKFPHILILVQMNHL